MKPYTKTLLVLVGTGFLFTTFWPMRYDLLTHLPSTPITQLTLDNGHYTEKGVPLNGRMASVEGDTVTLTPMTDGLRDGMSLTTVKGQVVAMVPWVKGLKEGEAQLFDPTTGLLLELVDYRAGAVDGMKLIYRDDGSIARRETWVNGVQEGLTTTFFSDGAVASEVMYHNGQQAGSLKTYNAKGVLLSDVMMEGTARHGLFTIYFEETGLPAIRGAYEHDAYQGPITTWSPDGSYVVEVYDRGQLVGPKKAYDAHGKRIETEFFEPDAKDNVDTTNVSPLPESPAESMENAEHLEATEAP